MSERLPRLLPADLTDEQRSLYEAIVGGPRTSGVQLFPIVAPDGSLNGPFGIMLHVPHLGFPLQELGVMLRYRTSLSPREREIAILAVAATTRSSFELYAHGLVGQSVGLSEDEVNGLTNGSFSSAAPREEMAFRICREMVDNPTPSPLTWDQAAAHFHPAEILELVTVAGYYRTISQMTEICGVSVEPPVAEVSPPGR